MVCQALLTIDNINGCSAVVDHLAGSKALATTEVKHSDAGAVSQRGGMELMLESGKGRIDVSPIPVRLVGMLLFAIRDSSCWSGHDGPTWQVLWQIVT